MEFVQEQTRLREQIESIEKEIRESPYHKGTEHHIGKLRARLAKLRSKLMETSTKKGGGVGYSLRKQGDATVVLLGPPSSGKSTLLNRLTSAKSKVAPYEFTTVSVIPGMMYYKDAKIQILDVPGLIEGAEEGKGRGREVLSVARGADLILLMTDIKRVNTFKRHNLLLEKCGVRLNIVRPNVLIEKKLSGGITIHSNIKQDLENQTIKEIASEMGIKNVEIIIKEKLSLDRLIDAFSLNRLYLPAIYVINKIDLIDSEGDLNNIYYLSEDGRIIAISSEKGIGLSELKKKIWDTLAFTRVYLVRSDEEPTFNNPIIMHKGETLKDVAKKIGAEFSQVKKRAKIWGTGAKFPGQEVSISTYVQEEMQVRFI
ncbi:hypothetical protein A2686_05175 [Candidatus Woesebacteria bacterium RIFCSPHIGHO2_01_FULL_38_10]|uniref:OBG-type G domain-containing protein n=1 Tax=Candidatus Woesebacteria bacterium RIFCSPLOWO2_01_FULL_39_10b TaxID=1802517 RepID=A0A1F8B736_9BACT|nr:MAG: hypothetical protein A2686_05175 [Candidatus Woesebacteria bacterium RIFCSPHIGHO2_01_FULL_38_10]OGM59509.1 MAG: hypothetical protein A2892_02615 [Candidatus Woesebacteria bacterium RIFCSPLOWO2_01_FULL_39_10b]